MKPILNNEDMETLRKGIEVMLPKNAAFALVVFPKEGANQHGKEGPNTRLTAEFLSNMSDRALVASILRKFSVSLMESRTAQ